MTQSASITLKQLRKSYKDTAVLHGLDITLDAGEFTVILGPSGCGKSTLLNLLAGLDNVSEGEILFGERAVQNLPAKDRGCAMVFQNYALYPHMTVADNIGYSLKIAKMPKLEREQKIAEVARLAELGHLLDRKPSQLSGGQRQRVAIARAIVREPEVLLFDEPLSNLDAQLRHDMRMELAKLHKRSVATSVFVTHDQVEAMTLADKILVLNKGKVEQYGTPQEIYHSPATTFVANFIGSPAMNLVQVTGEKGTLYLPGGTPIAQHSHIGSALMGIRPEKIKLSKENGVRVSVSYSEDLGSHSTLTLKLPCLQTIKAVTEQGSTFTFSDSDNLFIQISTQDVHLFDVDTHQRIDTNKD
ncbi:sn-glycerol-3-phosphate import ATP-binding protein UgpC 2 [Vibrio nigripulchritudo MADA3029]|uniref:ABC transporter ATP-binding protein n=1 Tax=Vibrio nigripulchritudo TaxID=28173 RepID=UPI0003B1C79B|nr:sn-glycerol-3-phosphate ABC transporter ATP-binding protein UgpC [Vibrio nigripulchritudo]CCN50704.1 sn-glycerol-3-phosphate import ATP-binding protein UgpC 2 [Vibrio nigripulchritudo MADA3020]CCN52275.1 sn-glycerol-3-phosphate import ATP-binding protein UgpC 2 [Vibrio nigripulchritudo MADA3021]CCN59163.1 sn-glycerol-3-phosphate import ATP-binding protein UgpC 2 [Vibrio nigripulchritudo MADA3029]